MAKLTRFLNNPYVLAWLLVAGVTTDLILLGRHYDLSKSDWAAWMQALGSVVAISTALMIGERQSKATLAAIREADALANKGRAESLTGMADYSDAIARKCLQVFSPKGFMGLDLAIAQLDDPLEVLNIGLNGIPLHQVGSGHAVSALILLRTSCGHLARALDRAEEWRSKAKTVSPDWYEYDTGVIRLCSENIRTNSAKLSKALGSS